MPRFAPVITVEDFKSILVSSALENGFEHEYDIIDTNDPDCYEYICIFLQGLAGSEIYKDWSKIQFDTENIMIEEFATTSAGIPYVRLLCGGDWEEPVHAIIYFDGKTLRGYVPTKGNTFKVKTKTAYGNDDEDNEYDPENPHKQYPLVDLDALNADISSRIQPREVNS